MRSVTCSIDDVGNSILVFLLADKWPIGQCSSTLGQIKSNQGGNVSVETICITAFAGISPFQLSVPCLVFGENSLDADWPRFQIKICASERELMPTKAGLEIRAPYDLTQLQSADMVIVPTWPTLDENPPAALLEAIIAAHQNGAVIVGLCTGAFVLAAAGLLAGRPATTHWLLTDELIRRYPDIEVRPEVLYVDDGDVVTSAGVAAGLDCCLHLMRRLRGAEIAGRVARRLVVSPHRQGGQAQFIEPQLREYEGGEHGLQSMEWLQRNLHLPHSLDSLAHRFRMSRRTFTRWFKVHNGTTVTDWLLHQRLLLAQQMLETTDKPLEMVAMEAGFGSENALRHHFRKVLCSSPARYRREFRGR